MTETVASTAFDLDQLLTQVVNYAREIVPFDHGSIYIYDPDTYLLAPKARVQPGQPVPRLIRLGEGAVGYAAKTREPILIRNVATDNRYIPFSEETQSELAVPMLLNNVLLGVLNIESRTPDAFSKDHVNILRALAAVSYTHLTLPTIYSV